MNRRTPRLQTSAAIFVAFLSISSPVLAQAPIRMSTPGSVIQATNRFSSQVVGTGRLFPGVINDDMFLRGLLHLPPASSGEQKMQRLIIHFKAQNCWLANIQVGIDRESPKFSIDTHLEGDHTRESPANTLALPLIAVNVSSQSVFLALTVHFNGRSPRDGLYHAGDVPPGPRDFLLTSVEVEFAKPLTLPNPTPVIKAPASVPGAGRAVEGIPGALVHPNEVIYVVSNDNQMLWFGHTGRGDGSFKWVLPKGKQVGTGWAAKHVFAGDDGVIYSITDNGDLMWYRHVGHLDGTFRWAENTGKRVGTGWNYKHVFPAGGGVIYAVTDGDDLLWFRHDGRADGSFKWATPAGQKVGSGWVFRHVFSGGGGVIYGITESGDLMWYRHDGRTDGTLRWAENNGKRVGTGWIFDHVFPAGNGVIYGIAANGELRWFRHDGRADGSFRWATPVDKTVGTGWVFREAFSGANIEP
jgi:Tachylectin